jgi:hypothetical protein
MVRINRSQGLVLGFFVCAVLALVAILAVAPEVYTSVLQVPEIAFLAVLIAFIAFLAVGVVRRWRWMFWLIVVAFVAGLLRVPASILELIGVLPPGGPAWYELLQGAIGVVQFVIALALLRGYRRGGVWGAF